MFERKKWLKKWTSYYFELYTSPEIWPPMDVWRESSSLKKLYEHWSMGLRVVGDKVAFSVK